MSKRNLRCKCPVKGRKRCKHSKNIECKDVCEIIQALNYAEASSTRCKTYIPPKLRFKPASEPKQKYVPMTPSMQTRLQYIGHCDLKPPKKGKDGRYVAADFCSTEYEDDDCTGILKTRNKKDSGRKRVKYFDGSACDIFMPKPGPLVKHTDSNKSIVNVASPKVSGEVIEAQRATVKPGEVRPPMPAKSHHELYGPHSGIVLNRDKEFVPDVVYIPGPERKQRGKKLKPCYKGGLCKRKTCTRKICRKYAAMRKKHIDRRRRERRSRKHFRSCSGEGRGGATDGTPRARAAKERVKDDDETCGLDEIPKPEHAQIPMGLKKGTFKTLSLTVLPCAKNKIAASSKFGILTGSFNMYDSKFSGKSRGRQALTMSVMAYCLAFHYHPKQWTMKLIDNLVDAGDQWHLQNLEKVHDHSAVQGICEVLPFGKKQTLFLNGKKMLVLLGEPECVGYTLSKDPMVYNLCRGLKAFFTCNRAGVMLSRVLKVIIWKDKVCYYIFDPAGRDLRAYSNYSKGYAALLNVGDLEAVAEVLLARSAIDDQKFILAPVKVLRMVDEKSDEDFEEEKEPTQAEKAMMGFRILDENCAIVNANMHLGDRVFEEAKYRQALTIAICAMTYAKISPPNTWFTKTLDKILRLGNKLYLDCLHPKVLIDLTIDNIPNEICVGPYLCEIIIYRERVKGQLFTPKECIFNIKTGLEEFFSNEYNSGILEFNNYTLAVWRQKEMFYLFDPYPRTTDGMRSFKIGRACCWMLLSPETMAEVLTRCWDYLPATTQFYIHAFKVLKLKKKQKKKIICCLSDDQLPGAKAKNVQRQVLEVSQDQGDGKASHGAEGDSKIGLKSGQQPQVDEEQMGDIISLVDSIQEDYLPPIPLKYKNLPPEEVEAKVVNLDSPTVSVTQIVPPWPKPRDKTNEPVEPDPDREPTPPPTPPTPPPPEGGVEEEEEVGGEEEEDEEALRRKAEEEEARRKAEELPPAMPPPPPTPQSELELPLAPAQFDEDEIQTVPPENIERQILLTEDARYRYKLRQIRKKMTAPLYENPLEISPSEELKKPSNFKQLPDNTEIIKGDCAINDDKAIEILPFAAIMAIVTSYKYSINTWTSGIVTFIVHTAKKLYSNKKEKFHMSPMHIIPKIAIGHQAYQANIDVIAEGPTWQLENVLTNKFFTKYDRGMLTTSTYSCAFFLRNGLYYLYDASTCNAMGLRDMCNNKGNACCLRFRNIHDLVTRIIYNKNCRSDEQQFILSRILVRRLLMEPRLKLPEDYDFETGLPKSRKSKISIVTEKEKKTDRTSICMEDPKCKPVEGYQLIHGVYRIEGTTALKDRSSKSDVKSCHFVCLIAMLMATMHPIKTWDSYRVDICIEKGLEIYEKAKSLHVCEKRVIKNILLDGKFIDINIKKIIVVNENAEKRLEQYLKAVLRRLRYVIIRFPQCSLVICQTEGYFHLFDPYPPPTEKPQKKEGKTPAPPCKKSGNSVATWTLYRSLNALTCRIVCNLKNVDSPEFYTFELTSLKTAPRRSALSYRLSPLFRPDENPNLPYLKRRRIRPLVDEKMYWLDVEFIPWSRMNPFNDLGFKRDRPKTKWNDWDIEFPGDLYSLWGKIHPKDDIFEESRRGQQYLATCVIAAAMTQVCDLSAWTASFLDGIVSAGDKYHEQCVQKLGDKKNYEINVEDLVSPFDMFPYSIVSVFEKVIFGFVYNIFPDRFNLSKALAYFFEQHETGILTSPNKNLAFGRYGPSYFMFDCQSFGAPVFSPGRGAAYILKCESLNRLIYCIALTLNIRRHGQQFHLYCAKITLNEKKSK